MVPMQDLLDALPNPNWRQLLFVTCHLHSILQERRKFGPIGWNVPYEFNQSDLSACIHFLQVSAKHVWVVESHLHTSYTSCAYTMQNHLLEGEAIKSNTPAWDTIRYMMGKIQYGGRITDMFDQLLMDTYVERYFHQVMHLRWFCWYG